MNRIILLCGLGLVLLCSTAAIAQDFEEYMRQQQRDFEQMKEDYRQGVLANLAAWEEYREREIAAFEAFKDEMERKWGDFKERSNTQWVEYRDGGNVRSSVDFERGEVEVEVIIEDPVELENIQERIKQEIVNTIEDKGTDREFPMEGEEPKPIQSEPILEKQVTASNGVAEPRQVAEELSATVQTREVVGDDGVTRTVAFVNFALAPDHLRTRAEKVQDYVYRFAEEHELDPALVFAIIHTESYYNPAARSWANALGLMQLVPSTGGRDAFRALYNEDGVPTQEYLFIPENNVRMGSVYINILSNRYLRGVEDPLVRDLLVISAYNTGAGNVARAYTGATNLRRALPVINSKTPEETYEFLIVNLPYEETRDYLQKVTTRRDMYREWAEERAAN